MEQSVPKLQHIKFRRRGIAQKKKKNMCCLLSNNDVARRRDVTVHLRKSNELHNLMTATDGEDQLDRSCEK